MRSRRETPRIRRHRKGNRTSRRRIPTARRHLQPIPSRRSRRRGCETKRFSSKVRDAQLCTGRSRALRDGECNRGRTHSQRCRQTRAYSESRIRRRHRSTRCRDRNDSRKRSSRKLRGIPQTCNTAGAFALEGVTVSHGALSLAENVRPASEDDTLIDCTAGACPPAVPANVRLVGASVKVPAVTRISRTRRLPVSVI